MNAQELHESAISYYEGTKNIPQDFKKAYDLFYIAAQNNYAPSQAMLGRMLIMGKGVVTDKELGFNWLNKSVESNNPEALNIYGVICTELKDFSSARQWYQLAVEQGNLQAACNLAQSYERKRKDLEQNLDEAEKLYKFAAESGLARGKYLLGQFYLKYRDYDAREAYKLIEAAAELGYNGALVHLGTMYRDGIHYNRDFHKAFTLYNKAFENGGIDAALYLADFYFKGVVVEKDPNKAIELLNFAALRNHHLAIERLGVLYYKRKEYNLSFEYFKKNEGTTFFKHVAEYYLGLMYYYGHGVKQDYEKAYKYFAKEKVITHRRASNTSIYANIMLDRGLGVEQNSAEVIRCLGRYEEDSFNEYIFENIPESILLANKLLYGIGIPTNISAAVKIWKTLSNIGVKEVNNNLAYAYYAGIGVIKNDIKSLEYLHQSDNNDNATAQAIIKGEISNDGTLGFRYINPEEHINKHDIYAIENKADLGDPDSMYLLAQLVFNEDKEYSRWWCEAAAKKGHPIATYILSIEEAVSEYNIFIPYSLEDIIAYAKSKHRKPLFDDQNQIIDYDEYELNVIWDEVLLQLLCNHYIGEKYNNELEIRFQYEFLKERIKLISILISSLPKETFDIDYKEYLLGLYNEKGITTMPLQSNLVIKYITDVFLNQQIRTIDTINCDINLLVNLGLHCRVRPKTEETRNLLENISLVCKNIHTTDTDTTPNSYNCKVVIPNLSDSNNYKFELSYISRLIRRGTPNYLLILVDREFCSSVNTKYSQIRHELIESRRIKEVIELDPYAFKDIPQHTSFLFIDNTKTNNFITFRNNTGKAEVTYEEIQAKQCCLFSGIYNQSVVKSNLQKIIQVGDLIKINDNALENISNYYLLDEDDFTSSLSAAIHRRPSVKIRHNNNAYFKFKGPHIFFKYDNSVKLFVNKTDELYCIKDGVYAFSVNTDIVDLDYFASILLNDKSLSDYFEKIVDGRGYFMPKDLLYKQIAIHKDKKIQKQIVEDVTTRERQSITSGVEYNIVVLSNSIELKENLDKIEGIIVKGKDQSFEEIYDEYIKDDTKAIIDAIVVDKEHDEYEELMEVFGDVRDRNIHIYIISDDGDKTVKTKKKIEYFVKGSRIYTADEESLKKLKYKLKDDLDSSNSHQAKIRMKYKDVFKAADALDKEYPGIGISAAVLRYIQTGCVIEDDEKTSGPCATFREVCHELLKVFIQEGLVPQMEPGAIPSLLRTGTYYDNIARRQYLLIEPFMSKSLSQSLEYFCKITNSAVHGSQNSSKLGTAALNILMEFIVWFYENLVVLKNIPNNDERRYIEIKKDDTKYKNRYFIISEFKNGKDSYFYSENIHFVPEGDVKLREGMKVKITSITCEQIGEREYTRKRIKGNPIIYYAKCKEYLEKD